MGAILGALGFAMSLLAIWFTTEALRRADSNSDALIRPHIRDIKFRLENNRNLLAELDNRMTDLERQVKIAKAENLDAGHLTEQVETIKYGLDQARSFKPSAVYNA